MAEEKRIDPFVAVLKQERQDRKITLTELGAALDTPHATLSNYETGTSATPRVDLMRDWASLLDHELVLNKVEKPTRRRRSSLTTANDIPEDLAAVYLSRYQIALAMGMLIAQSASMRDDSPAMAGDLKIIADILARSIH